jgi:hypothetical protein
VGIDSSSPLRGSPPSIPTRLYALAAWGILVVRSEEKTIIARKLEVARFLAARDAPTTRPSCVLPAGPHQAHGAVVSLWEYCVHDASVEVDAGSATRALAEVHAALAGYDGLLPSFTIQIEDAGRILADHPLPALASDDRAFLTETHLRL